ncbi:MAG TPA: HAMP domain-containing sensor histidine kinase [Actinomycetota bacterium]|nr:HAMP domain-containing sensor histidine kinase [Actinomycetota bacterium]
MRFSLRTRILAGTLVLVALGLAVAGFVTYGLLRKSLYDRMDSELAAAQGPVHDVLQHALGGDDSFGTGGPPGPDGGPGTAELPSGAYAALYRDSGAKVVDHSFTYDGTGSKPDIPLDMVRSVADGTLPNQLLSVPAVGTGPGFRSSIYRVGIDGTPNGAVVVGIPLSEVNQTLHKLVTIELAVVGGVLLALGLLSWWLVRLGLRPLDRMAVTAGSIAAGDLSKRVQPADDTTEVGKLGTALNTMLGQIETSFEEQRASEARLRRFVADASHELRTPLTSIRGYAELFRRGAADRPEDLERAMRRIEDEGARMGLLVDDLLLLARLDQGRPLERKPVDLTALVTDAADDLRAADPDRPVTLDAQPEVGVTGDEPRLRQVVANVLDNARSHTPAGTPVDIRLRATNGTATLEVSDDGPGMTAEEQERVFERFYRGDPSRSRESGGTGLGLSIAAAIIQAHGGTIGVRNTDGDGATFRITLPLLDSPTQPAAQEPAPPLDEPVDVSFPDPEATRTGPATSS